MLMKNNTLFVLIILSVFVLFGLASMVLLSPRTHPFYKQSGENAETYVLAAKQTKQYTNPIKTSHTTITPTPTLSKPIPNRKVSIGFAVEPITPDRISKTETEIGRKFPIVMLYKQWGNPQNSQVDVSTLNMLASIDKTPFITWEPWDPQQGVTTNKYKLSDIGQGTYDGYIRDTARNIKTFNKPVFLRFAHEMNGNWYPWGGTVNGNSPQMYINAWKHIHEIFASEGVTNVTWVWSPDAKSYPLINGNTLIDYYPGDTYVDWIGLDGYNWGPQIPGKQWETFSEVFSNAYNQVVNLSQKPIMISEFGSTESGGNKASWIQDALDLQIPYNFTRIQSIIWFDINRDNSWNIDSSNTALAQIKASLGASFYTAMPTTATSKIFPQ